MKGGKKMKNCRYCGSINEENEEYCSKCGRSLTEGTSDAVSEVGAISDEAPINVNRDNIFTDTGFNTVLSADSFLSDSPSIPETSVTGYDEISSGSDDFESQSFLDDSPLNSDREASDEEKQTKAVQPLEGKDFLDSSPSKVRRDEVKSDGASEASQKDEKITDFARYTIREGEGQKRDSRKTVVMLIVAIVATVIVAGACAYLFFFSGDNNSQQTSGTTSPSVSSSVTESTVSEPTETEKPSETESTTESIPEPTQDDTTQPLTTVPPETETAVPFTPLTKYVNADGGLRLRKEKDLTSEVHILMPKGTKITVTQTDGDWGYTEYKGLKGWCSMKYLSDTAPKENESTSGKPSSTEASTENTSTTVPHETTTETTYTNYKVKYVAPESGLRLRSDASVNSNKLDLMPQGARVNVISEKGTWSYVDFNGKIGWCSSEYLSNDPV